MRNNITAEHSKQCSSWKSSPFHTPLVLVSCINQRSYIAQGSFLNLASTVNVIPKTLVRSPVPVTEVGPAVAAGHLVAPLALFDGHLAGRALLGHALNQRRALQLLQSRNVSKSPPSKKVHNAE